MAELIGIPSRGQPALDAVPYRLAGDPTARLVATALHAGHDVRPEVAELLAIDEADRLREEDPYVERLTACADFSAVVSRSRFEIDLNRRRDAAVYMAPEDSWGLGVWRSTPPPALVGRSLQIYDAFYAEFGAHLDQLAADGPFVVFDIHSYNHRRHGPTAEPSPQRDNPDVNLGTGTLSRRWRAVVDAFAAAMGRAQVSGHGVDVRENVRFRGGHLARWVHARYPSTGCVLALEFKKTFMDEWTGALDVAHLAELQDALQGTVRPVLQALEEAA